MIAILITTFNRDELLYKAIQRLVDLNLKDCIVLVGDQGNISEDKRNYYNNLKSEKFDWIELPFDCGLSYGRNRLVELAKEKECEYCILGSDSFLFTESIEKVNHLIGMNLYGYDLLGWELIPSTCGWEAKLKLIEGHSFELDFIEKDMKFSKADNFGLYECDICRNIFIAKTESLFEVKWDENFRLCEHEDFFYRYKLQGFKVAWTNLILSNKMTDRPTKYADFRRVNFQEGKRLLMEKYNIKGWVSYQNLQRAKDYCKDLTKDK